MSHPSRALVAEAALVVPRLVAARREMLHDLERGPVLLVEAVGATLAGVVIGVAPRHKREVHDVGDAIGGQSGLHRALDCDLALGSEGLAIEGHIDLLAEGDGRECKKEREFHDTLGSIVNKVDLGMALEGT